jgi:transposase
MPVRAWGHPFQGARAYVHKLKEPKTSRDRWRRELIERAGHGKAAVAFANKNARTAWAMLTQGEYYQRRPALKVAA